MLKHYIIPISRMVAFIFLSIFFLLNTEKSNCQTRNLNLKHLSSKDGLSSNEVRAVFEDSYGFMWFATSDGLNRWDGYKFKVFKNYNNDSNSLPNYFLLCLAEDSSRNIWIGTNHGGLARYNTVEDRFYRYATVPDDETSLPGMVVRCVFKDSRQNMWVGTHSGLAKYNPGSDSFERYTLPGNNPNSVADIRQIFQQNSNEILIQSDLGLFTLHLDSGKILPFEVNIPGLSKELFSHNNPICFDSRGFIWIGAQSGLFKIDNKNGTFKKYTPDATGRSINSSNFSVIFEDSRTNVWIGTENRGLNLYNQGTDDFSFFTAGLSKNSITNNIVSNIYEDSNSTIWISTLEGGVSYFSYISNRFNHYSPDPFDINSLSGSRIGAFQEDEEGFIWIGTEDGGLNKFSPKENRFKHYRLSSDIISPSIMSIENNTKNSFYISGLRMGLYDFNTQSGKFTNLIPQIQSLKIQPQIQITDLFLDSQAYLWISTHDKEGILVYDPEEKVIFNTSSPGSFPRDLLAIPYTVTVMEDSKKRVWIGTYLGLFMYADSVFTFLSDKNNKNTPGSNYHYTVFEDSNNNLWIGNSKGLDRLVVEGNRFSFERCSEIYALPENVKGILEDNKGNLWLSSNLGLTRFNPHTKKIRNFKFDKEIRNQEFSERVCYKSTSGELYFGGINGFLRFNPDSLEIDTHPLNILITDFQLFNVSQSVGGDSPLKKSIISTDKIELTYNQSVINLEYAALNFNNTEVIEYAYIMEGFDKGWNYVGEKRFASYTNLPHGNYIFRVKVAGETDHPSSRETSLMIEISPPFWLTTWAKLSYLVLMVLLLYFFRKAIINREKLKNELQLEKNKIEATREADIMKLRFFTNISHELKTPLTLIKAPVEKLINSRDQLKPDEKMLLYQLIQNNSEKLLKMVNQLLDFRKLEAGRLVFEPSEGDIVDFCKKIWNVFKLFADQKRIGYYFESNLETEIMLFDANKIETIVSNLLSNALKYTAEGGSVTLSIGKVSETGKSPEENIDRIEIVVKDSGIGIPENETSRVFDRFYTVARKGDKKFEGTGIGLTLVKEFAELHQGTVTLISKESEGSEFRVTIPLNRNSLITADAEKDKQAVGKASYSGEEIDLLIENNSPGKKIPAVKRKILIVEDDKDLRTFLRNELMDKYDVSEASDGQEGLEIALTINPDLIVSDIMMPKINGIDFCRRIKSDERTSHLPVILLTAMHSQENQIEGLETGADDYIFKPFNVALLKTRVNNLLVSRDNLSRKFNESYSLDFEHDTLNDKDKNLIQSVIDIVVENIINEKINADFISRKLLISRSLLYIKIEALTGQSVNEFVRNIRLKKSTSLLLNKKAGISEVAYAVGFSSQSYFTRCFTKKFGISPSEMQEKGGIK